MKKVFALVFNLVLLIVLSSCSSGKYVVSVRGDIAEITCKDDYKFVSEIISIHDTAIIFSTLSENYRETQQLFYEPIENIKSITIRGYDGSGWLTSVLLFQVVPAALFTAAAVSLDSENSVVGISFIIPAITAMLFATSEGDTPQWNNELPVSELENLKKFSRYPEGMNQELLSNLLKKYNQTGIIRIIRRK